MTETNATPMVLKEDEGKSLILLSAQQHYNAMDITTANVSDSGVDLFYANNDDENTKNVKTFMLTNNEMNLLCSYWTERQNKIKAEKEAEEKAEKEATEKAYELIKEYPAIKIIDAGNERWDVTIDEYRWTSSRYAYNGKELLEYAEEAVEYYKTQKEREEKHTHAATIPHAHTAAAHHEEY